MIICTIEDLIHAKFGEHTPSHTDLAAMTGIDRRTWTTLKRGPMAINFATLDALCAFFGCQPGDIFKHIK